MPWPEERPSPSPPTATSRRSCRRLTPDVQAVAQVELAAASDTARQAMARTREWLSERPTIRRAGLAWPREASSTR